MPGANNILGISEVNPPAVIPVYAGINTIPIDKGCVRILPTVPVTGTQQIFLTDDGTGSGVPLFSKLTVATGVIYGDPGLMLSLSILVNSNIDIVIFVYDSSGLYGASIDVSLSLFGELP